MYKFLTHIWKSYLYQIQNWASNFCRNTKLNNFFIIFKMIYENYNINHIQIFKNV